MSTLGELIVKVVYDTVDKAADALDRLGNKADKTKDKTKTLSSAFKEFAGVGGPIGDIAGKVEDVGSRATSAASGFRTLSAALGGAVATAGVLVVALVAVAGAAGILAAIRYASVLDDIGDLADKLGYSATQALLLKQQMDSAGTSIDTYVAGQQKIANALAKSDEEGKAAAEALKTLGVNATATTSPMEVLNKLTEEYKTKLKDGTASTDEMAALQLVLGKSYREVMVASEQAAIAQKRQNEYAALGIGISSDGAAAASQFEAAQNNLSFILQVVGSQLVGEIVPAFTALIEQLVESYKNGGLVKVAFQSISLAAQLVMVPIRAMIGAFMILDTAVTGVGKSIGALFAAIETRSMEPFKALKEDLKQLDISLAERMKKVAVFGSDSGAVDTKQKQDSVTANKPATGKPKKDKPKKEEKVVEEVGPYSGWGEAGRKEADYMLKLQIKQREEAEKIVVQNEKLASSYLDMIEPARVLNREIDAINQSTLSTEQKAQAIDLVTAKFYNLKDTVLQTAKEFDMMQRVSETAFQGLEDSLVSLVTTGKLNFKSMVSSMLADLARLFIQLKIIKPLMNGIMGAAGGGSFLGSAFGNAFGGVASAGFGTGAGYGNMDMGAFLATGTNYIPYDGFKAVLHEGEAVVPKQYNPAAGAAGSASSQTNYISITVEGGKTNEETGNVVSQQVLNIMKGIARQEISTAKRTGGMLNPV